MMARHHHHCQHCGAVCRGHSGGAALLAIAVIGVIAVVGVHDRTIVDRAIERSRALEEQRHFGAAIAVVESARPTLWVLGASALDHRRAVLEFRAARPNVWPHDD